MITASHINKTYTSPDGTAFQALNDISFSIDQGEFVGIIGPSGAGKTTLLRTLNLFDPPTSGSIVIDGQEVTAPGYPVDRLRQKGIRAERLTPRGGTDVKHSQIRLSRNA